ncbi:hypothetical protein ACHAWO_007055 [Cyclotella atomus]|jgi:23S rRNA (cytosine1962-C5)-methyltransferase|uniref:S-adenosylmethionine-dependent methyltransferase domain-containing protein n=1 Tax=Cyclotella atomus TaxID=382360 RepID=A0ABD3NXK6_9STRA
MAVCYHLLLVASAWLEIQYVDGLQLRHADAVIRRSSAGQGAIPALSSSYELDLQKKLPYRTLGHPDLLQAIANFPNQLFGEGSMYPSTVDAQRLFHGRGGLYEGANHLTLDFYPPVFLLTSFEELKDDELDAYSVALGNVWKSLMATRCVESNNIDESDATTNNQETPFTWVHQCRAEKGNSTTRLMTGTIPDSHIVTESNGKDKYYVHLLKGQNHGLFLDMSEGRKWLQRKCAEPEINTVLNLFAYTCAFSVAALNGGAETVVNVDMSRGALKTGQRNHDLNKLTGNDGKGTAKFLSHDLFKSWGKIKRLGPYDVVVADPPSYQKGSFVASKDYIKVIRRLPSLLRPYGYALLCLNAPELTTEFLLEQVNEGVPNDELCFVERLDNPLAFASAFPEKALKVLVFQYKPMNHVSEEDDR